MALQVLFRPVLARIIPALVVVAGVEISLSKQPPELLQQSMQMVHWGVEILFSPATRLTQEERAATMALLCLSPLHLARILRSLLLEIAARELWISRQQSLLPCEMASPLSPSDKQTLRAQLPLIPSTSTLLSTFP